MNNFLSSYESLLKTEQVYFLQEKKSVDTISTILLVTLFKIQVVCSIEGGPCIVSIGLRLDQNWWHSKKIYESSFYPYHCRYLSKQIFPIVPTKYIFFYTVLCLVHPLTGQQGASQVWRRIRFIQETGTFPSPIPNGSISYNRRLFQKVPSKI